MYLKFPHFYAHKTLPLLNGIKNKWKKLKINWEEK